MSKARMKASDLVVTVLALSPILNESIMAGRLSEDYLTARMCSELPKNVLRYAGIVPHKLHGDSIKLNDAITELVQRGVIGRESPGRAINWKYSNSPEFYFNTYISPNIDKDERARIERFSRALN